MPIKHFVTGYDSGIKWEEWAVRLYGDGKLIVAAEHLKSNAHVHFHGDSQLSAKDWKVEFKAFKDAHPIKKIPGAENLRPTKEATKGLDETGYQYVAKEKHQLYSQGVSEEEMSSLRDASEEHFQKLKNGMKNHIHTRHYEGAAADVFRQIGNDCIRYNRDNGISIRPQYRTDVYNTMLSHPDCNDEWMDFINSKLL